MEALPYRLVDNFIPLIPDNGLTFKRTHPLLFNPPSPQAPCGALENAFPSGGIHDPSDRVVESQRSSPQLRQALPA